MPYTCLSDTISVLANIQKEIYLVQPKRFKTKPNKCDLLRKLYFSVPNNHHAPSPLAPLVFFKKVSSTTRSYRTSLQPAYYFFPFSEENLNKSHAATFETF